MANQFVFANNVSTTLASPITTSGQTSIVLSSAANLPTISGSQQFALTLNDAATRAVIEIVYVTSRVGATLTVVRGQEGTTATTWLAGDYAYGSATAGVLAAFAALNGTTGPLQAAANANSTTTPAYVLPAYTAAGASFASTQRIVTGQTALVFPTSVTATSVGVTLTNASVFTSGSSYYVIAAVSGQSSFSSGVVIGVGVLNNNNAQFTITGTASSILNETVTVGWIAIGT